MSALLRIAVHLTFYPTQWVNSLICVLGIWRRWDWIDDNVAIGMLPRVKDLAALKALGVIGVVNMCEEFAGHIEEMSRLGMTQLHLPTLDYHCPSEAHLRQGVEFIRERVRRGEKVYVHCKAGRGRSPTMAMCYLIVTRNTSAAEAYAAIKKIRPQVEGGIVKRETVLLVEANHATISVANSDH